MRLLLWIVLLLAVRSAPLLAQCADGSPPPCARPAVAPAARPAIDLNRIAILPFRVTTADTLLGEGLAELIATEFTSEGGPRAVHMGNVLRAWRRAGGGTRTPLSQADGIRVAREVGAGLLIEGSIIGLGSRLRINASVVKVQDGSARRIEPVGGSADSVEVLLGRLTAGLLVAAGGTSTVKPTAALTDSPEAMRAYLEGFSHWRRARYSEAAIAFERAWVADTLFGQAAFMRYRIGQWQLENAATSPWTTRARTSRSRLSREDQLLHLGYFGEPGAPRTRAQGLAELRRAAMLLPESPDAQYRLGDNLWHFGASLGVSDWVGAARDQFQRALALDSLAPILQHLLELGLVTSDTALVRRVLPPFAEIYDSRGQVPTFVSVPRWGWVWLSAGRLGDAAMLAALRRQVSDSTPAIVNSRAGVYGLSAALTDEMYTLSQRHGRPIDREISNRNYFVAATLQGRPSAAARVSRAWPDTTRRDVLFVLAALFADGDSAAAAAAAERLTANVTADSVLYAEVRCALAHWRLRRGHVDDADDAALGRLGQERCADVLALDRAARRRDASLPAQLARADSSVRRSAPIVNYSQFEHILVARHLEASGALREALEVIRARSTFQALEWTAATCARIEGRLAAAVGDTVGALRAYRHYLLMRRDAEPLLIPQRDSVRAELARLERR